VDGKIEAMPKVPDSTKSSLEQNSAHEHENAGRS